jgi:hypothetical protein
MGKNRTSCVTIFVLVFPLYPFGLVARRFKTAPLLAIMFTPAQPPQLSGGRSEYLAQAMRDQRGRQGVAHICTTDRRQRTGESGAVIGTLRKINMVSGERPSLHRSIYRAIPKVDC